MSLITSELLQKLCPKTPKAQRDRFLPYLNDALPRYQINTELRLAAFLATICFESGYLRYTKEIRATKPGKVKRLQDKYWGSGYYGRGLIQLTHEDNYKAFARHIVANGNGSMDAGKSIYVRFDDIFAEDFPDLVAFPFFAVESACWYWQGHNLNKYADKGQFFAIQGLVNRGNAKKEAIDYPERLKLYDLALRLLPDDLPMADETAPADGALTLASIPASETPTDSLADVNAPSFLDKVFSPIEKAKQKIEGIGVEPSSISKSSAFTTILTTIKGLALTAIAFFYDNPLYLLGGIAVFIAAVWFFSRAKANATARVLAFAQMEGE